jgi:penicillin G amidase
MTLIPKIKGVFALVFLLGLVVVSAFLFFRRSGLPSRHGEFKIAGLEGQVEIIYDSWGVPQIRADHDDDAIAALGWAHANDRFTQMELGRRAGAGRLAEVLGANLLPIDRHFRRLRLAETADRMAEQASPKSRATLAAYARGVNAWLEERDGSFSPELRVLGFDPEPWQARDGLLFALLMAVDLSFWDEIPEEDRYSWLRAFGPEATRELLVDADLEIPAAIAEWAAQAGPPRKLDKAPPVGEIDPPGSNNWAIGPSRSKSGFAMVANDPHLGLHLPSVWFQALIHSPGYRAAGMTLPGTPGVVIGRGDAIAWAFTNTMLDDHDIFFEELDPSGAKVKRGDLWLPITSHDETIKIRGGDSETIKLRATDRGPLFEADPQRGLPARSLTWTAYLPADPVAALAGLAMATTPEAALAALETYTCPAQNLVAAFADGTLLFTVIGGLPERKVGDGRLPSPGWDLAYGWNGIYPRAANPRVVRPPDDFLVTANHDIRPPDFALPISAEFFLPSRADRIRERLLAVEAFTRETFSEIQIDDHSLFARELLVAIADDGPFAGPAQQAFEALQSWDRRMAPQGKAALFVLFQRELLENIFGDEQVLSGQTKAVGRRQSLLALLRAPTPSRFIDDLATTTLETRKEIIEKSLQTAWLEGEQRWGGTVATWNYGRLHSLTLRHRLDKMPFFGPWMRRGPFPLAGSAETVLAFGARWQEDGNMTVTYGPSMRWVVDWSQPDRAFAVLPGGQSGHPADPHYDDQIPLYRDGRLRESAWSDTLIEQSNKKKVKLLP